MLMCAPRGKKSFGANIPLIPYEPLQQIRSGQIQAIVLNEARSLSEKEELKENLWFDRSAPRGRNILNSQSHALFGNED